MNKTNQNVYTCTYVLENGQKKRTEILDIWIECPFGPWRRTCADAALFVAALIAQPFLLLFVFFYPACDRKSAEKREKNKENGVSVCFFQVPKAADLTKKVANNNSNQNPMVYSHPGSVGIKMWYVLSSKPREKRDFFVSRTRSLCLSPKHFQTINVNKIPPFSFPMDGARLLRLLHNTRTRKVRFPPPPFLFFLLLF